MGLGEVRVVGSMEKEATEEVKMTRAGGGASGGVFGEEGAEGFGAADVDLAAEGVVCFRLARNDGREMENDGGFLRDCGTEPANV